MLSTGKITLNGAHRKRLWVEKDGLGKKAGYVNVNMLC